MIDGSVLNSDLVNTETRKSSVDLPTRRRLVNMTAGQRLMVWLAVWRNSLLFSSARPRIVSRFSLDMTDPT